MSTSPEHILTEVYGGTPISEGTRAFFQLRLRRVLHQCVLKAFMFRERTDKLRKSDIADRIQKSRARVTKWLRAPGNWTIDTVSDLLLAMGMELEVRAVPIGAGRQAIWSNPKRVPYRVDAPLAAAANGQGPSGQPPKRPPITVVKYGLVGKG